MSGSAFDGLLATPTADLSVVVRREARRTVVDVSGEVDIANAAVLSGALFPLARLGRPVLVDLRGLAFLGLAGIEVLLHAGTLCAVEGLPFALAAPGPAVARVLQVTRAESEVTVLPDLSADWPAAGVGAQPGWVQG